MSTNSPGKWVHTVGRLAMLCWLLGLQGGCDSSNRNTTEGNLFAPASGEQWSIRCWHSDEPDHARQAEAYAAMLRQVKQLKPKAVRVATEATGSTIYYGDYSRVTSKATGQLVFPPEFQKEIEFIRSLSPDGRATPFFTAQPELLTAEAPPAHPEWDISHAKGTHSLLIAVFYNTPTFDQRKEAAGQYVEILRQDGFTAYFYHEPVKSFVFVGDFTVEDYVATPQGARLGPRVQQLIARRPEEFKSFTENGHIRKYVGPDGKMVTPSSQLVKLTDRKPTE